MVMTEEVGEREVWVADSEEEEEEKEEEMLHWEVEV